MLFYLDTFRISTPSAREILVERDFDAPRRHSPQAGERMLQLAMRTATCLLIPALVPFSGQAVDEKERTLQATKPSDREIVLTRSFDARRPAVFDALTKPNHLLQWMNTASMSLVACDVDFRAGGSFRYVFERGSSARLEVRGAYQLVDPPHRFVYLETYDFSPLQILVTTTLKEVSGHTDFTQTLMYSSKLDRDTDYEGVVSSSEEVYARLERYLASGRVP